MDDKYLDLKKEIEKINERGQDISSNQISNMANIHQSLLEAKNCEDLIYFVEDDYIHEEKCLVEMIETYERLSSQLKREIFICPSDYPYLYTDIDQSKIFAGSNRHWRSINKVLCTFLVSKEHLSKYWDNFNKTCLIRNDPFEKHINEIFTKEICISPLKSLAVHITNINSSYGLSPYINYMKLWKENENV